MKTTFFWMVLLAMIGTGILESQEQTTSSEPEKEYKLTKAYAYRDEQLVLSASDFFGCFVLEKDPDTSLIITDLKIFSDDSNFSSPDLFRDGDSVYLNRGEKAGLHKGQKFVIKGMTGGKYLDHTLVTRKGIGEIVNIYTDTAEMKIVNLYNPIEKGDFLEEYKEEQPVSKLKIPYDHTIVPDDADSVKIFLPDTITFGRTIIGPEQFVAIEMGKDKISVGDMVVFFDRIKAHLPPLIIGTGVAVVVGNQLSTVKVIDSSHPLIEGAEAAILPEPKIIEGSSEGPVPVVRRVSDMTQPEGDEEMLTVEIPFEIDSSLIDEAQSEQFVKIKSFIEGKTVYSILLKGYCCSIGNEEKNLELSKQRVESVKKILLEQLAVPETQLETAFYGEKEAPYDNSSEAERRKNRLVMVVVVRK